MFSRLDTRPHSTVPLLPGPAEAGLAAVGVGVRGRAVPGGQRRPEAVARPAQAVGDAAAVLRVQGQQVAGV